MTLNDNQHRVYEWLSDELNFPVYADAYKGALYLLHEKSPGHITFVAHAGRDLMNGLAPTFAGIKRSQVDYPKHLDKLHAAWLDDWKLTEDLLPEGNEKGHYIPIPVCQKITKLIDEHNAGRKRSSNGLFFSTFLDYDDKDKIPKNFLEEWKSTKKWFLDHAHLRKEYFNKNSENDLVSNFGILDGYLYIAASSQFQRLQVLNEILEETNT